MKNKKHNYPLDRKRKYTLNQNYFESINNQEKAYFLGFMYADGCVSSKINQCSITQNKDKYILEKFQSLLGTNNPLYWRKKTKSWTLNFCSVKMKQDLIKAGCMPNKTFKVKFPSFLREDLKPHFIRGFNDGDGSIFTYFVNNHKQKYLGVKILGRENFLKSILNLTNIRGHIHKPKNQKFWILRFSCSFAISFCNWLYKDATIFLERKYQKYVDYLTMKQN